MVALSLGRIHTLLIIQIHTVDWLKKCTENLITRTAQTKKNPYPTCEPCDDSTILRMNPYQTCEPYDGDTILRMNPYLTCKPWDGSTILRMNPYPTCEPCDGDTILRMNPYPTCELCDEREIRETKFIWRNYKNKTI